MTGMLFYFDMTVDTLKGDRFARIALAGDTVVLDPEGAGCPKIDHVVPCPAITRLCLEP